MVRRARRGIGVHPVVKIPLETSQAIDYRGRRGGGEQAVATDLAAESALDGRHAYGAVGAPALDRPAHRAPGTVEWASHAAVPPIQVVTDPKGYAVAKRIFDIVFALLLLLFSAPLCLLVAIAIKVSSPGPVLYRQTRVGRGGELFTCLKFRSMVDGAHDHWFHLRHHNDVDGPVLKIRNDPRTTAVGKVIRKFSIDEIPQALNVIAGRMSIVGPRPPLPEEVVKYEPHHFERLAVKPGLTCIWQVSGRSKLGFEDWVALDREYIARRSFWFDLKLTAKTIPAVLIGRGAH